MRVRTDPWPGSPNRWRSERERQVAWTDTWVVSAVQMQRGEAKDVPLLRSSLSRARARVKARLGGNASRPQSRARSAFRGCDKPERSSRKTARGTLRTALGQLAEAIPDAVVDLELLQAGHEVVAQLERVLDAAAPRQVDAADEVGR